MERPNFEYGWQSKPQPGVVDAFTSKSAKPPVECVPTYAVSTERSYGSRRSTATFQDWMRPRETSSAGVRISYVFGNGMFPELRSGPAMSGMPFASVVS